MKAEFRFHSVIQIHECPDVNGNPRRTCEKILFSPKCRKYQENHSGWTYLEHLLRKEKRKITLPWERGEFIRKVTSNKTLSNHSSEVRIIVKDEGREKG